MNHSNTYIIALSGKKGSGKTTVKNILKEKIKNKFDDYEILELSFASPLKKSLSTLFNIDIKHFNDPMLKEEKINLFGNEITPRKLMQCFADILKGSNNNILKEIFNENIFVNSVEKIIIDTKKKYTYKPVFIIIDDLRYPNEADMLKKNNAILIRVNRPNMNNYSESSKHSSETSLDNYDFDNIIENSSTLKNLYLNETINKLLETISLSSSKMSSLIK